MRASGGGRVRRRVAGCGAVRLLLVAGAVRVDGVLLALTVAERERQHVLRLCIYVHGLLRMSEGPSVEEKLRKMALLLVSEKARKHEQWLKTRKLKAYLVLPGQIKALRKFQEEWSADSTVTDEPDYKGFCDSGGAYIRKIRNRLFWRQNTRDWGRVPNAGPARRQRQVRSPYMYEYRHSNFQMPMITADHSRGSADGANTWLDRFLIAADEFNRALLRVEWHPRMQRLLHLQLTGVDIDEDEDSDDDEQLESERDFREALCAMKAEYAAVYALSLWSPETRIPDPSRVGRDPESKWFADGGTFVVWSVQRQGYVPLQDPQGVQAELLREPEQAGDEQVYIDLLKVLEMLLVNLPGDFGDFEARIEAKIVSLEAELTKIVLVAHANERESPFYPDSDEGDEAGAAAVRKPAVGGKKRR